MHGVGQRRELAEVVWRLADVGAQPRPAAAHAHPGGGEVHETVPALQPHAVQRHQRRGLGLVLVGRLLGPLREHEGLVLHLVQPDGEQPAPGEAEVALVLELALLDVVAADAAAEVVVPVDDVGRVVAPEVGRARRRAAGLPGGGHGEALEAQLAQPVLALLVKSALSLGQKADEVAHARLLVLVLRAGAGHLPGAVDLHRGVLHRIAAAQALAPGHGEGLVVAVGLFDPLHPQLLQLGGVLGVLGARGQIVERRVPKDVVLVVGLHDGQGRVVHIA